MYWFDAWGSLTSASRFDKNEKTIKTLHAKSKFGQALEIASNIYQDIKASFAPAAVLYA